MASGHLEGAAGVLLIAAEVLALALVAGAGLLIPAESFGQASAGGTDVFVRKYDIAATELWTRQFGTSDRDFPYGFAGGAHGVYVVGTTTGALPGQVSIGGADAFVRKYDQNGHELWTRQFGTADGDLALGVAVDASGAYVVGTTGGMLPGQACYGGSDAFLRKYDADGNELWTRQFGTESNDDASAVAVDSSGVYVAGSTDLTLPGQPRADCSSVYIGEAEVFLRKYNLDGNEVWTRQYGTPSDDYATGVAAAASGVYVVGSDLRKFDPDGNELWIRGGGLGISVDASGVYVAGWSGLTKYDPDGKTIWTRSFSGTPYGVAVYASSVYVAGETAGDAFVRKYDIDGNLGWTRQFGTAVADAAWGVAVDESGVYVAGATEGTMSPPDDFPPVLGVPEPIIAEATGPSGATVFYSVTAEDDVDGSLTPVCNPASGSLFPHGTTMVTCTATDSSGNTATASFTVKIQDTTGPALTVPDDISLEATGSSGAVVTYQATAADLVDPSPIVVCSPSSGSTFGFGTTTVTCTATDSSGNAATASFRVTVTEGVEPAGFDLRPFAAAAAVVVIGAGAAAVVTWLRRKRKGRGPSSGKGGTP